MIWVVIVKTVSGTPNLKAYVATAIVNIERILQAKIFRVKNLKIGGLKMLEREIKAKIIKQVENMAKILAKGKDCEIRRSADGVSIAEISKKVVAR